MNGSIVVTLYDKPKDFEVSVSDNGYFCENESSVKISVSGQQESYIYRLMGYIDPENALSVSEIETYIGDNSNAAFTFTTDIVTAGKYFVVVDIPNFEESYGACSTVLKDGAGVEFVDVKSVSIKKPTIKVAKYEADEYITERLDNIVVCEDDYVDIVVGGYNDLVADKCEGSVQQYLTNNGVTVNILNSFSIELVVYLLTSLLLQ